MRRRTTCTGSAGKITNCQIGAFATDLSRQGQAFIDQALYLPKSWTDDPVRLQAVSVPRDVGFAAKRQLASRMAARAEAAVCRSAGLLPTACMVSGI